MLSGAFTLAADQNIRSGIMQKMCLRMCFQSYRVDSLESFRMAEENHIKVSP